MHALGPIFSCAALAVTNSFNRGRSLMSSQNLQQAPQSGQSRAGGRAHAGMDRGGSTAAPARQQSVKNLRPSSGGGAQDGHDQPSLTARKQHKHYGCEEYNADQPEQATAHHCMPDAPVAAGAHRGSRYAAWGPQPQAPRAPGQAAAGRPGSCRRRAGSQT